MKEGSDERFRILLSSILGIALMIGLLWYVGIEEILGYLYNVSPVWLAASIFVSLSFYLLRAWRWKLLLKPVKNSVHISNALAITVIGYFVNTLIPIRIGEFIRAFLLKEKEGVGFAEGFSSIVVERVLDVMGIVMLGVIGLYIIPPELSFPYWFIQSLRLVGGLVVIALAGIIVGTRKEKEMLVLAEKTVSVVPLLPGKWRERVLEFAESLIRGARGVGHDLTALVMILLLTAAMWTLQFLNTYFIFKSLNYDVLIVITLLGSMIILLSFILPAPPGFAGTYEAYWSLVFVTGLGLELLPTVAAGVFSHLLFMVITIVLGSLATVWMGIKLGEVLRIRR